MGLIPRQLFIFFNHPAHNFAVSIYVWRRHILFRAENGIEPLDKASTKALQLGLGELFGIYRNAAFAATHWNSGNCAFETHPKCQRFYFFNISLRMKPNPALVWTSETIMLYTIALKNFFG